ncbi:YihY/virulence factor BrkB family protein [Solirubrobacter ginsenosidimutans]|uniref:YihY/virulence factor BrkB family protein n=1 Tax=Solirubrobacter ginsenosidimutans TaxID=490573 RepID=A0A9X3S5F9_9ACTN|nr:YhjD/YihY/BrkB family envelope integrity protein [Solirubrobacter ginsenosidimutans]MDA0164116.1 YihY/virulence factor BrkB family protein [Solirubrobacter ginsenosidimutans]
MTDQAPRERTDPVSPEAGAETRIDLGAPAERAPAADGLRSAGGRAMKTREEAARRAEELRKRSALVDAALEAGDIDRRRAGSLLAGGIAFRIFLWLLPAALFVAAVVGLWRPTGDASPERVAQSLGLAASVASTVAEATRQSDQGAAALLAIGIALMLLASMSLIRALRIAHVLAWEEPLRRPARAPRDGAIFSAALVAMIAIETGITYLRHQDAALSLLLIPVSFAITGGTWLGLSLLLPHANANWRALLPGAALFAIGHALLQVATVYYFAPKLTRAPALYGSLGSAATLLLWLFLISRIVVAAAFLNAALWRRSGASS